MKVTVDGTDGDGKPLHTEWTGKYDGKDYLVTGDTNTDTRSYEKVNDHTLAFTNKKGDKVTIRSWRRVGRRQDPHGHQHRNRFEGQEVHQHSGVRQAVEEPPDNACNSYALPFFPGGRA